MLKAIGKCSCGGEGEVTSKKSPYAITCKECGKHATSEEAWACTYKWKNRLTETGGLKRESKRKNTKEE